MLENSQLSTRKVRGACSTRAAHILNQLACENAAKPLNSMCLNFPKNKIKIITSTNFQCRSILKAVLILIKRWRNILSSMHGLFNSYPTVNTRHLAENDANKGHRNKRLSHKTDVICTNRLLLMGGFPLYTQAFPMLCGFNIVCVLPIWL